MAEDEKPSRAELNRRKLQASLESPRLGVPEKQRPPWVYTVPYSVKRNGEWSDGKIGIALLHEYDGSIARDRRYISEKRLHSALGYVSPNHYERSLARLVA